MVESRQSEDDKATAGPAAPMSQLAEASAKLFAEQAAAMAMMTAYGMSMATQMTGMMLGALRGSSDDMAASPEPVVPMPETKPSAENVVKLRPTAPKPAARPKPKSGRAAKKPVAAVATNGDDLKKIAGIGPRLEDELNARGIVSYAALAKLSKAALRKLDTELGLDGRAIKDDWIGKARALAEGKGDATG